MSSPGWNVLVVSPGGMTSCLPQRSSPNNLAFHPSSPTHTYLPSLHLASPHLPILSPLTLFFTSQTPPQHQSSLTMGISAIATSVGSCFADTIKSSCGFATRHPWMTTAAALATAGALYKWWTNPSRGTRTKQGSLVPHIAASKIPTPASTGDDIHRSPRSRVVSETAETDSRAATKNETPAETSAAATAAGTVGDDQPKSKTPVAAGTVNSETPEAATSTNQHGLLTAGGGKHIVGKVVRKR